MCWKKTQLAFRHDLDLITDPRSFSEFFSLPLSDKA